MKRRIFRAISLVALCALLASFTVIFGLLYRYFTGVQEQSLLSQTELAAAGVETLGASYFEGLRPGGSRFTWIGADGTVLYDSAADPEGMENHGEREEFLAALERGYGESSRFSATLAEKTLYRAKRLSDGSVIRVSATQDSVLSLLLGMLFPFLLVLGGAVVLAALLAQRIAARIVKPLNAIDLDDPLSNEAAYAELAPLLSRMELQHKQIALQLDTLKRKQEEFNAVTGSMREGLILLNDSGSILSINRSAMALYGTDRGCIGRDMLTLDRSLPMQRLLEGARRGESGELRRDFGSREYQLDASPILSGEQVRGTALLLFDVTEKARAEQMRREFTANVSHELKTPLQTIAGSAEIMRGGLVKPGDTGRFLEQIYSESKRMIDLVEDIIRLSKLDEGAIHQARERISLKALCQDVAAQLEPAAQAMGVGIQVLGEEAWVDTVPALAREIVYNLADNAVKYNREGGSVSISLEDCALTVKDTGIGIPAAEQERVFERFYRVDKSHSRRIGGTGLGLSIVKHAAMQLGAKVELESREGEGSAFRVLFPRQGCAPE